MPVANKSSLVTLGDFFRLAERRFRAARLAYGHGTSNARDEAAFLVLEALGLPIHSIAPWLALKPTKAERARLSTLIDARISRRMPAPYLLGAAYMHGVRFHIDRRALIPRSFIGDMLADGALPIGDPRRVRRILDLCTGSGCLAVLGGWPSRRPGSMPSTSLPARSPWRGATWRRIGWAIGSPFIAAIFSGPSARSATT
jgi:ribosomal protein L3 glutamine methyltransferase